MSVKSTITPNLYLGHLVGRVNSLPDSKGIKIVAVRNRKQALSTDGMAIYQNLFVNGGDVHFKVELDLGPVTQTDHRINSNTVTKVTKVRSTKVTKLQKPHCSHLPPKMLIAIWNGNCLEWYNLIIPAAVTVASPSKTIGDQTFSMMDVTAQHAPDYSQLAKKIFVQLGDIKQGPAYQMVLRLNTKVDPAIFSDMMTGEVHCYEFAKLVVHTNL